MSYPKLYTQTEEHNQRVRDQFEGRYDRPLIIVGNGPSALDAANKELPRDGLIFRMNWFFLEPLQAYGDKVDGYFWSVNTPVLQDKLVEITKSQKYIIKAYFSPMRPVCESSSKTSLDERFVPFFDHWAVIAENQTFARELMGRPLPTQGFQVLAFALVLGFRDIHLAGIDLYESSAKRYPWTFPTDIAAKLSRKDLEPGYESKHSLDRDIAFFETCLAQYPAARVHGLTHSKFLSRLPRSSFYWKETRSQIRAADTILVGQDNDNQSIEERKKYKLIDGKKCAFVTLVAGDGFHHGLRALANSLDRVTDVPLVVMCTPDTNKECLQKSNVFLQDIDSVDNPNCLSAKNRRFMQTYSKLAVFGLTEWDRLVYVDADTVVLQNVDELFDVDEFAAAPDLGIELRFDRFNSGVFCCQPSAELYRTMVTSLDAVASYDGGDQGFLNCFFPAPRWLDRRYNVLRRLYVHDPNLFQWSEVKVLHFVGRKPWEIPGTNDGPYAPLRRRWLQFLNRDELVELLSDQQHRMPKLGPGRSPRKKRSSLRKLEKLARDPVAFVRDMRIWRYVKN